MMKILFQKLCENIIASAMKLYVFFKSTIWGFDLNWNKNASWLIDA